jgi:polysaccharide export outer membrane protein
MKIHRIIVVMTLMLLMAGNAMAQKRYITVLGEVNRPGTYAMPHQGSLTVTEALAEAGDMTVYGMRTKIRVTRAGDDGEFKTITLNLDKRHDIESPYYQLRPDDRIYVVPNKAKTKSASFGRKSTIWVSMVSTSVSIATMILTKLAP